MTKIKETPTPYATPPYINTTQAATRLGSTKRTIRKLCNTGALQSAGIAAIKVGEGAAGDWRVKESDITALFGDKPALTPEFVATVFDYDIETIRIMCRSGRLKAIKLGGEWRIPASAIEEKS